MKRIPRRLEWMCRDGRENGHGCPGGRRGGIGRRRRGLGHLSWSRVGEGRVCERKDLLVTVCERGNGGGSVERKVDTWLSRIGHRILLLCSLCIGREEED